MSQEQAARPRAGVWRARRISELLAPVAVVVCVALLLPALRSGAAETLNLATADDFAILAGSAIVNTGTTTIVGDVGSSPIPAISGFETVTQTGTNHNDDPTTVQAKVDLAAAYAAAAASVPTATVSAELGGTTLTPGVYSSDTGTFAITGALVLDSQGDPNAVFIFQSATTFTTAVASSVSFANVGSACNVFWQVGSSAVLGSDTQMIGSILALASITSGPGSDIDGRLLAQGGAVTIDSSSIIVPACTPPATTTSTEPPTTTTTEPPTTTTTEPPPTTTTTEPATTTTTTEPATTTSTAPGTTMSTSPGATTTTTAVPDPTSSVPGSGNGSDPTTPTTGPAGITASDVAAATVAAPVVSTPSSESAMATTGSGSLAFRLGATALATGLVLIAGTRCLGARRLHR